MEECMTRGQPKTTTGRRWLTGYVKSWEFVDRDNLKKYKNPLDEEEDRLFSSFLLCNPIRPSK